MRHEKRRWKPWIKGVLSGVVLVFLVMIGASTASADSFDLSVNNLGISGTVGTITLSSIAGGVEIAVTMNSGFSLKLQDGNDVGFNSNTPIIQSNIQNLSFTVGSGLYAGIYSGATNLGSGNMDGFGAFDNTLTQLNCASGPPTCPPPTSADSLVFDVIKAGLTLANLEVANDNGAMFAVHFCTESGGLCGPSTGFATNGGVTVPEPGTLSLFGAGLVGVGTLLGKRWFSRGPREAA